MSKKSRRKHLLENYDIGESLGEGGNGEVFLAINKKTRSKEAVKVLRDSWQSNKEKVERFKEEISVVNRMQKTMSGILPILEYDTDELWFTMPVAERIVDYIKRNDASAIDIIQGISFISETLSHLHKEGISHRDIKPENMYYCNGQFCISDFGLAKEESTPNGFTKEDKGLGAIFTIAPEMKRNPKGANGYAADVYSLAKTLWMLLMKNEKWFDGVYDFRIPEISLHSNRDLKETSLALIDDLLIDATKINPTNRPTMDEFNNRLLEWLNIQENWELIQETEWRFLKKYLFGDGTPVPRKAVWTKKEDIIYILNTITVLNVYNHMLLPSGGGLDFYQATEAAEDGCICIEADDHELFILKPEALYFESFEGCDDWNFFYLQIRELAPVIDGDAVMSEYIVEDYPGHYVSARYAQYGVYDYDTGEVLPKGFRCVDRYCKGSFLIVMKDGPYNDIHSAYDARHSKMGYPRRNL